MKKKAKFIESNCDRSPFCAVVRACPTQAVSMKKEGFFKNKIVYDAEKCVGCGKCEKVCPHAAFAI